MAKRKVIKRGTRKSTFVNKRRKGLRARLFPWFKRFGISLAVLVTVLWIGAWFFLSDADTVTADWANNKIVNATAGLGFKVDNILIEGRVHTDPEILKAIINVRRGEPLFAFDPKQAKEGVEKIAWVESAHVERRLPDTLYIKLNERKPLALWQQDKKLKLIDTHGDVIPVSNLDPFYNLVIVLGDEAPKNTAALFNTLIGEPEIFKDVESAGLIADRRWDIIMKNDMRIKLPENDVALAVSRLAKAQREDGILDKDLLGIDLRDPVRMIVRTKPGASQEYGAGYSKASSNTTAKSGNNI
ncbi:MAG: FtsQ-type POTRA domain-containing protein [Alphaproteobacteria bacterium]|nr:FtsQ-type POTRA domain-containing protein [Alphaproteobacteria bacterium]